MDTDDNGNNVLNARVRYFQNENNDKLDYLNVPDVYMNNVLSSMRLIVVLFVLLIFIPMAQAILQRMLQLPNQKLSLLEWKILVVLI